VDQRKIPAKVEWYTCRGYRDVIKGIKTMVIRGAPAIGVAAAMGLALGAGSIRTNSYDAFRRRFREMAAEMVKARPTAVNLRWAVERMCALVDSSADLSIHDIKEVLREESKKVLAEDIDINRRIGRNGQDINRRIGRNGQVLFPKDSTVLTHCNAGSLATGGYGTALGVIRAAHETGKNVAVLADETRPWLQGLRLTSFELMEDNIPVTVIADNAAGSFMRRKMVDLVVTGADRIAANGDVANKIGTYQVAVLAKENRVPFYVAAPLSTIDMTIRDGDMIPVEERSPEEITHVGKQRIGPQGVKALNPAFDITPAKYVTAIITEQGVVKAPYRSGIRALFRKAG
ncbi:MAG: S-methyl-5-thioribose-1-phosphate isomerase, partial [Deltaproteobacteria bacterium]|nr:S-methyl-5-thioribose-1-phosphate isomerase [Deltaproteobacteria bacterium]